MGPRSIVRTGGLVHTYVSLLLREPDSDALSTLSFNSKDGLPATRFDFKPTLVRGYLLQVSGS